MKDDDHMIWIILMFTAVLLSLFSLYFRTCHLKQRVSSLELDQLVLTSNLIEVVEIMKEQR